MLQQFLPLLTMTFFISLFIVLMQFLWQYIDDLVGKGLTIDVVGELFFYAALTMVPTALPLAVLLASLMTFGNLGEKFELTAMKASGISLFRIMKPLIILMVFIAIGAFFFQNNILPVAQTKMWTLLFSVRQKSPEVEIPERAFYDQIPGLNLYAEHKNRETGMLYDLIIYDVSRGMDNTRVILADSGKISFTEDKTHLFVHLYEGEMFENQNNSALGFGTRSNMPFRRESFHDKKIYTVFDANFNRMDEKNMRSQYIGKNIAELRVAIDSLNQKVDSIGDEYAKVIKEEPYFGVTYHENKIENGQLTHVVRQPVKVDTYLDIDSVFNAPSASMAKNYIRQAIGKAERQHRDFEYRSVALSDQAKLMRRHDIEMQKKFTLSFACIIFFFIGAPLGAIIKKGGIGAPLVISVLLFIVYFIIDNTGYKLARDGKIDVTFGIWLSSMVLLPMGIFLTYKAVGDSAVFNIDAYRLVLMRLIGRRPKRSHEYKEIVMDDISINQACEYINNFNDYCIDLANNLKHRNALYRLFAKKPYRELDHHLNTLVEYLSRTRVPMIIELINRYPVQTRYSDLPKIIANNAALIEEYNRQQIKDSSHSDL